MSEPNKPEDVRPRTRTPSETVEAPAPAVAPIDPYSETIRVKLAFPITVGGSKVGELTFRRPKLRDRLLSSRNEELVSSDERMASTIANAANLTLDELRQLDLSDYARIEEIMGVFLSARPKQ